MATVQAIINQAQILLLDTNAVVFSTAGLLVHFNNGQRDLATKLKCLVVESNVSVASAIAGHPTYSLPSTCIGIDKIDSSNWSIVLDEATTQELDYNLPNWQTSTAVAASAYVRDRRSSKTIRLYPNPTLVDTLQLRRFDTPADITSLSSTSLLPQWMHQVLLYYVVGCAAGEESDLQDMEKAKHFKSLYETFVDQNNASDK